MMRATGAKLRMLASDEAVMERDEDETAAAASWAGKGEGREPSDDMVSRVRCEWLRYRGQGCCCDANHGSSRRRMRGLAFRGASIVVHLSGAYRA